MFQESTQGRDLLWVSRENGIFKHAATAVKASPLSIPDAQSGACVWCWANSAGALQERSLLADLGFMCNTTALPWRFVGRLTQLTTVTFRCADVLKVGSREAEGYQHFQEYVKMCMSTCPSATFPYLSLPDILHKTILHPLPVTAEHGRTSRRKTRVPSSRQ